MTRSAPCTGDAKAPVQGAEHGGGGQVTSRATLTEDGTLVVQRLSIPIDLGDAVRDRIFTGLHVQGKPTNLRLLGSLTHLTELRLQSTGHTDFTDSPSMAAFSSLRRLELINLRTWPSLAGMEGATNLEWLCVSRTTIQDGRWEMLLGFGKLEFVGGMADAFGRAAADEFRERRPEVRVVG